MQPCSNGFFGAVVAVSGARCSTIVSRLVHVLLIAAFIGGCTSLPPGSDFPKTPSLALDRPEQTRLGRGFETAVRKHGGNSGFRLLPVGIDGFYTRVQMANAAERTLDVQYFIFREDYTGKILTDAILRAADRNVRVRVLLDDTDVSGHAKQVTVLGGHPHIEVRLFNPFAYRGNSKLIRAVEFMFDASRLDYRMHNKLLVVDNGVALIGGRNVGDEYFQASHDFEFSDYDVFAAGPIVKELSATFDAFWNSAMAIPVEALEARAFSAAALDEYRKTLDEHRQKMEAEGTEPMRRLASGEPLAGMISGSLPLIWTKAEVVHDSPEKARGKKGEMIGSLMHRPVANTAAAVQSELLMVTPYFVPGEEGVQLFKELRKRNVRVRVLTNSLESTDVPWGVWAHAGYMRYRLPLIEAGVELYELRAMLGELKGSGGPLKSKGSERFGLHAKVFVFDRRKLFIGSMNFDQRSLRLNTEIGLIIDSPELARQVAARFESIAQPANSYAVILRPQDGGEPPRLFWRTEESRKTIDYYREPARSAWQRIKAEFLSLLPLDNEL